MNLVAGGGVIDGKADLRNDGIHAEHGLPPGVLVNVHHRVGCEQRRKCRPVLGIEKAAIARFHILDRFKSDKPGQGF